MQYVVIGLPTRKQQVFKSLRESTVQIYVIRINNIDCKAQLAVIYGGMKKRKKNRKQEQSVNA